MPAYNRGDAAETFKFAINFFPSTTKLVHGSIQDIEKDTIVKWEVDCAEIDPNELQLMEEKAVRKLVEKIGETVFWGPEQEVSLLRYDDFKGEYVRIEDDEDIVHEIDRQEGWASLRAEFFAELIDLNIDSKVGYVLSYLVICREGNVTVVDWNAVELEEPTDLVIAPIADTEMAKLFGILVDDRDEEERDEANTSDNDDRELSEDVDEQLMEDDADVVDDAHDEELVHVYDKENPVIRVGKLWPNIDEFRLSFKTYAVRHQFDAKTFWTDRKKFYAKCRGFDGSGKRACKCGATGGQQKERSYTFVCGKSSVWGAEVREHKTGRRHVVNTELHDCSCLEWQASAGVTRTEEIIVKVHTIETEAVVTEETDVQVHTVETEVVHTEEFDQTESAIEFHEVIASGPMKKTKMISELVYAVQPKTRNAKAKKGTRRSRKR
ncbi:hypothetical protein D1007_35228 [Hordeum vulgare]|nr:hypothetical protein D1007_35228 [Hordeum vulgare]